MGQAVNKFVSVSMAALATRPLELATALLDSWGLTAALVSGQVAGLDGSEFLRKGVEPCWPAYRSTASPLPTPDSWAPHY